MFIYFKRAFVFSFYFSLTLLNSNNGEKIRIYAIILFLFATNCSLNILLQTYTISKVISSIAVVCDIPRYMFNDVLPRTVKLIIGNQLERGQLYVKLATVTTRLCFIRLDACVKDENLGLNWDLRDFLSLYKRIEKPGYNFFFFNLKIIA